MKKTLNFFCVLLLLFGFSSAYAQDAEAKRIMQKIKEQVLAPVAFVCVEMKIFNAEDNLQRRFVFKRGYFYDGGKEKILIDFTFPSDMARTRYFLVEDVNNVRKEEIMWLPSLRRERLIANANEGSLQGSHYFFYDLLEHIDNFDYFFVARIGNIFTILGETDKPKVYGRLVIKVEEIRPDVFVYREIVFFDKKQKEWKKELYENFNLVWDMYYRPNKITMLDLRTAKKTVLKFSKWEVRSLKEEDSLIFQRNFLIRDQTIPPECE